VAADIIEEAFQNYETAELADRSLTTR
jgi:hypothetical protein